MTSDKTFGLGSWRDKVTPAAGSVVAAVAILILIGWQGGATILAGWGPGLATMKPITAACFLAAGAVLALDGRIPHRAVHGLGWLLSVLGAFAIAQDLTGFAPWLWDLLAPRGTLPGAGSQHFSMSTSTAVAFTLAGVALAQRRGPLVPITGSLVGVIAAVALLGYAFGSGELYSLPGFESISLPTALCLLILSVGILFRPDLEWPRISLKTALGTLVSAALLPAVVFMLAQAQRASVEQTTTLERDGRALADKVAILVDRIVAERSALLKALATSPLLKNQDLARFYDHAKAAVDPEEGLILVIDRSSRILLNTAQPYGAVQPPTAETAAAQRAFATGELQISDVFLSPLNQQPVVSLVLPVAGTDLALRITMRSKWFSNQLVNLAPPGWAVAVYDRNGLYLARSRNPQHWVGRPASPTTIAKVGEAQTGWTRSVNVEDVPIFVGWKRMPFGWTALVGVESSGIEAASHGRTRRVSLGVIIITFIGLLFSLLAAFALGQPLARLADAAMALGRGEVPNTLHTRLREIDNVSNVLTRTANDRLAAETALRQSEALLRTATDNAAVGLVMLDAQRRYTFANPAYTEILGLPLLPGDLIGKGPADVLAPVYAAQIAPRLDRVFAGERVTYELSRPRPGGTRDEIAHYVVVYDPRRNNFGAVDGAIVTIFDISHRKAAEDLAVRLAAIVEASSDAILGKTLDGRITSWNEGAERLLGFKAQEMIGQSVLRLIPAELHSEEDDIITRISAGELIQSYETVRQLKNGDKVDVSITVSPIRDQTGKVIGASTIARDITERKRAEERQQTLMSELDHRVKNTLARLRAVVGRSREGAVTVDDFALALDQRLEAMARTHARFSSSNWTGAAMHDLADDELEPYRSAHKISIQGPEVSLRPAAAQSISMVLHELTTNAAKYGSLSVIEGRLSLTWGVRRTDDGTGSLDILWQETCGPRVSSAVRPGFGSLVIRRQLKHELSANVNWIPAPEGVRCEISIPLERVRGDA